MVCFVEAASLDKRSEELRGDIVADGLDFQQADFLHRVVDSGSGWAVCVALPQINLAEIAVQVFRAMHILQSLSGEVGGVGEDFEFLIQRGHVLVVSRRSRLEVILLVR